MGGRGGSSGLRRRPRVSDINAFGAYLKREDKISWLKKHHSKTLSDEEAEATIDAAVNYSEVGYKKIHNGQSPSETRLIDAMIEDPSTPVYDGDTYRGIQIFPSKIGMDPKEYIENIIKTGVWREPGVSSFSSTRDVAEDFGGFLDHYSSYDDSIHVMIINRGRSKGMPFKHISNHSGENEVLMSSKTMLRGLKIVGYSVAKDGREYYIEVDDSIQ